MSLALRPYQHDALAAISAAHERGVTRQLVALPTGQAVLLRAPAAA